MDNRNLDDAGLGIEARSVGRVIWSVAVAAARGNLMENRESWEWDEDGDRDES